jgi:plasmid stability protein
MANLQVRDIDSDLYETLKRIASQDHRSLSQEVVKMLEDGIQMPQKSVENSTEAFLALSGAWDDSRTAEEIVGDLRKERRDSARFGGTGGLLD